MMERWRDILDDRLLNRYEISDFGRIRNKKTKNVLRLTINTSGYPRVTIRCWPKSHSFEIHRLVASSFIKNPTGKEEVNHKDTVKKNNYYKNLEWCNRSYNVKHSYDNDVKPIFYGVNNQLAKLSNRKALLIYKSKGTLKEIAAKFQISFSAVSSIKNGKTWRHVTGHKYTKSRKQLSSDVVKNIFLSRDRIDQIALNFNISKYAARLIRRRITYTEYTKSL